MKALKSDILRELGVSFCSTSLPLGPSTFNPAYSSVMSVNFTEPSLGSLRCIHVFAAVLVTVGEMTKNLHMKKKYIYVVHFYISCVKVIVKRCNW